MAAPAPNHADIGTILTTIQETNTTCRVTSKLQNGGDYIRWKREMILYLRGAGLWSVINQPPPPEPHDDIWTRRNDKALSAIHNACVPQQQDLIIELDYARDAWNTLLTEHESRDSARVQIMWNTFHSISKLKDESIADYVGRIKSSSRQLLAAGETVSDSQVLNRTIQGLTSEFHTLKSSLAIIEDLTEARLLKILLREEARLYLETKDSKENQSQPRRRNSRSRDPQSKKSRSRSPSPRRSREGHDNRRCRSRSRSRGSSRNYCNVCKRSGHTEQTCFYLHPELLEKRRQELVSRSYGGNYGATWHPTPTAAIAQINPVVTTPQVVPTTPSTKQSNTYALPLQLTSDTVWDYYDQAMYACRSDEHYDHAMYAWQDQLRQDMNKLDGANTNPLTCSALHRHPGAMAYEESWSVATVDVPPAPPISIPGVTPIYKPGQYVQTPTIGHWLIDSGASNHFTASKHILSDFQNTPDVRIQTGNLCRR